jgi:hypothetical protein
MAPVARIYIVRSVMYICHGVAPRDASSINISDKGGRAGEQRTA